MVMSVQSLFDKKKALPPGLSWSEIAMVAEFLERLMSTVGSAQRYSLSSPLVVEHLSGLKGRIELILEKLRADYLQLSELHGHLVVNDHILPIAEQKEMQIAGFVYFMLLHNIRSLTLDRAVNREDLAAFIEMLIDLGRKVRNDPAMELRNRMIKHVHITPQEKSDFSRLGDRDTYSESPTTWPGLSMDYLDNKAMENKGVGQTQKNNSTDTRVMTLTAAKPKQFLTKTEIDMEVRRKLDRPEGHVQVMVLPSLGRLLLDDAKVQIVGMPQLDVVTTNQRGANFFLEPGAYKLRVSYDEFFVEFEAELTPSDDGVQFNVNLMEALNPR